MLTEVIRFVQQLTRECRAYAALTMLPEEHDWHRQWPLSNDHNNVTPGSRPALSSINYNLKI